MTNIPQDAGSAMLHTVEAVKENEDGSVTVTTDRGGLQQTIAKDAVYGDFNGRQIMASDDLRVGARTFASYNTVQESSPAQALADLADADLSLATGAVAFTTAK